MKNRIFGNGDSPKTKAETRKIKEVTTKYRKHSKKASDYEHYAVKLINKYGPFISLDKEHWRWTSSIWQKVGFARYRAQAVKLQPDGQKSCIVTDNILKMLSNITQKDPDEIKWQNACRFNGNRNVVMLSVKNGVIKLTAVNSDPKIELVEPNKDDLVISQLPIEYDAKAKCPTFDYILKSTLPHEADRYMLQCFVGYCLVPDHRFQCVLYCYGAPNSGKSLLILQAIGAMFDETLMSNVSLDDICKGGDGLRAIERSLVNISTEINSRKLEDSSVFNQIACGEPMNKALKWEKDRRLVSNAKHIFIGNHLPRWDRGSDAQARRIKILFFPNDFSRETKDGSLERKVKLEITGIFNWALEGLKEVLRLEQMPLGSKESQTHAEQFKKQNNPMGTFSQTFCKIGAGLKIDTKVFSKLFSYWCELEGIPNSSYSATRLLRMQNPHIRLLKTKVKGINERYLLSIDLNEKGQKLWAALRAENLGP